MAAERRAAAPSGRLLAAWTYALAAGGALLTGCSHSGVPARARTLVLVQTQPIEQLFPAGANGAVAQELAALMHRYLVTLNPAGALVADAAAVVPSRSNGGISPDGRTLWYHLRPGLRFSDGSALRARDVAATLNAMRDPRSLLPSRIGIDDVVAVDALGAATVRVRLARPYAPILLYLCAPGNASPILPAEQAGIVRERAPSPATLIGAGPYRLRAFLAGERLLLEPNPWYSPRPSVPELLIRSVGSAATANVQLQSREAAGYVMGDPALQPELAALPGLRTTASRIDGLGALIFNTADPLVTLPVRRAVADTLDVAGDVRRVFHGALSSQDAAAGLFLWAYDASAFPQPRMGLQRARALLDGAGWRLAPDGRRYRDGVPLELTMIVRADQASSAALASAFAQELLGAGISVSVRQYAVQQFGAPTGPLYGGRFQLAVVQFLTGFDPDPTDQFACGRIPPNGYNKARYCNLTLDRLLVRAAATSSRPVRLALYRRVQMILARDLPVLPLYRMRALDALPAGLHGVTPTPATLFYGVANWR